MFNFKNDYNYIAHENILNALVKYQNEAFGVYGLDSVSDNAKNLIRKHINGLDVDIHFLVGGTILNKTIISHVLRPYEAVVSATSGHINVHETGAIESTGHKVVTINEYDGKIKVEDIRKCLAVHTDEHMVLPKMVYISQSTEYGTVYSKDELKEIYDFCKMNNLYLFVDGARLGVALATESFTLDDLAHSCDAFYIGATKNGALLGEALVVCNDNIKENVRFSIKQNGGMYSKGYVAGIQFEELFKDNLFMELAKNANRTSKYLYDGLVSRSIKMSKPCVTNQIFPIVSNDLFGKLNEFVSFELWEDLGEEKVVRFVCSFKTTNEYIDAFFAELDKILN